MSHRLTLLAGLFLATLAPLASAQEPKSDPELVGYFLGLSVGQQISNNGCKLDDFDFDAFKLGFSEALEKKELSDDKLKVAKEKFDALLKQRYTEMIANKKQAGVKWLAENAKKEGVKQLGNGLQYKVLASGKGASPAAIDTVRVHYTGRLIDGTIFDSSVKRGEPAEFAVGQVIRGWTMALQKMKVGDKWMLYIPSDLAYGANPRPGGPIGPHEVLIFEVELLAIL